HLGGSARAVKLPGDYRRAAVAAARHMGLNVAGVDLLPSDEGPMVLEVNSSPGLEGIEKSTKADVADAVIAYIERNVRKGSSYDRGGR
ncbi:MAG TPA: hypothetical protein VNU01_06515, partial [Egibacteraceae bacterium]|nr:hypothetical protein [Egibacteraceae bacterium]